MNLHELLGTAVADLPELPDQLADVERIHHRRDATKRAGLISLTTALVLGVGTLTITSPWASPKSTTTVSVGNPAARLSQKQFAEDAAAILQDAWPVPNEKVAWDPAKSYDGYGNSWYMEFQVTGGGKSWEVGVIFYGQSTTAVYPELTAPVDVVPSDCVRDPSSCTANADHSMYAQLGLGGIVYVSRNGKDLLTLWTRGLPSKPTMSQLQQLGMSDAMQQIYLEAGRAGLLVPGTPLYTPWASGTAYPTTTS